MDLNPVSSIVSGVVKPVTDLIDDLFTSDEERAAAKLKLTTEEGRQALAKLTQQMSAINNEANSKDPWTSRARPSFMYVMYVFILAAVPMGALFAYDPEIAKNVASGVKMWLDAIPGELYTLFGFGYLGYGGMRTWEKHKGVAK